MDWCAERGNRELVIFDFLYDDGKIFALLDNGTALLIDIIPKKVSKEKNFPYIFVSLSH